MPGNLVPNRQHALPKLNHAKDKPYIDYPLVYQEAVTTEPFYVEYDFTICSSNLSLTTLYKWNGVGWTEITGFSNPDVIFGRGFYAVTTSSAASVAITEHTTDNQYVTAIATPR